MYSNASRDTDEVLVNERTKAWLESPHRHDVDTAVEQVLQKDEQAHMTVKRGGSLELDEHVNVAVWVSLVARQIPNGFALAGYCGDDVDTSHHGIIRAVIPPWLGVQQRARRHGNAGIHGDAGIVESVTYRVDVTRLGSNPTLSESFQSLFSIT